MGGRAAEQLIFDTTTSGAQKDLQQVVKLARKMVEDWGMSEKFGHLAFDKLAELLIDHEEVSGDEVKSLVKSQSVSLDNGDSDNAENDNKKRISEEIFSIVVKKICK